MRASKFIVPIVLICATAFAVETRLPFKTVFKGQDQFNRLVSLAQSNDWKSLPIGERTAVVGQALTGTRYKSYTLEIDKRIVARTARTNGSGRFEATALPNSKKSGRQNRTQASERRDHRNRFARWPI